METAPDWMKLSELGYTYGFEILEKLPETERLKQIQSMQATKRYAEAMLKVLEAEG